MLRSTDAMRKTINAACAMEALICSIDAIGRRMAPRAAFAAAQDDIPSATVLKRSLAACENQSSRASTTREGHSSTSLKAGEKTKSFVTLRVLCGYSFDVVRRQGAESKNLLISSQYFRVT
jgi:hypothetical protein